MFDLSKAKIVKRTKGLYGGVREYEIIFVESDILYGTGDYEDPPEIADNQSVVCYYCGFENLIKKGDFNSWRGGYLTLDEAEKAIEAWVNDSNRG